jgi:hypothetical protein
MRGLFRIFVVGVAVLMTVNAAPALVMAARTPLQRAATADAVIVGKVTAIEKEPIEVTPFPGAPNKVAYKVAVVKVQTPLAGADNLTHVKIAFLPRPAANPNPQPGPIRPRPGFLPTELKENDEFLFFLSRHPDGGFYAMSNMSPPIALEGDEGKKTLESVKKLTTALADPMKGLKSQSAEERYLTAGALLTRYRNYPDFAGGGVDQEAIPADESRLILKALLERDWTKPDVSGMSPTQLFFSLGLNEKDGWTMPKPQQGMNFNVLLKDEFAKWLDGAGKDYRIKKLVSKKK